MRFSGRIYAGSTLWQVAAEKGNSLEIPWVLEAVLEPGHGLLKKEICRLKPTAVVFFTGPKYHSTLKREFPGAEFITVRPQPAREFAQVSAEDLPEACFRLLPQPCIPVCESYRYRILID